MQAYRPAFNNVQLTMLNTAPAKAKADAELAELNSFVSTNAWGGIDAWNDGPATGPAAGGYPGGGYGYGGWGDAGAGAGWGGAWGGYGGWGGYGYGGWGGLGYGGWGYGTGIGGAYGW